MLAKPIDPDTPEDKRTGGSTKRNTWLGAVIVILLIVVACLGAAVAYLQLRGTDDLSLSTIGKANQNNGYNKCLNCVLFRKQSIMQYLLLAVEYKLLGYS